MSMAEKIKKLFKKDKILACSPFDYPSLINYPKLMSSLNQQKHKYHTAVPYRHIVIDGLLNEDILGAVINFFPGPDEIQWISSGSKTNSGKSAQVNKLQFALGRHNLANEMLLHPIIRYLLLELNSATFTRFLSLLTDIPNIITDQRMWGGGLHQTIRGGMLRVHADFLKHPEFDIDRRINVLLFLNSDWEDSYGGSLELWNENMQRCVQKISPLANRCVIFNTSEKSYHGYTEPLNCPEGITRKSIAMYYYTVPDMGEKAKPETYWQDLPNET